MEIYSVVILADGLFPSSEDLISKLRGADLLICCDGAIQELETRNIMPDIIVGDLDSISDENRERYESILYCDPDQESNDLTKAVEFAQRHITENNLTTRYSIEVTILGATGKREDHTLGNISLLPHYSEILPTAQIEMLSDWGRMIAIFDSIELHCKPESSVSIFSFDPTLKIRSAGLKYPTDLVVFDYWWKATLNIASESRFSLEFSHPAKVVLFIR